MFFFKMAFVVALDLLIEIIDLLMKLHIAQNEIDGRGKSFAVF